ncbi:hypothetical protein A3306_02565 [Rickettsia bellii]|nr:hypothetical protein A3306_02565 [Rickettsia bellii]KJV90387.1 putative membrane protein [Rickettsia bellii str. RML An4]
MPTIFYYSINKLLGIKISTNIFANGLLYIILSLVAWRKGSIFLSIVLQLILILPSLFSELSSLQSLHTDLTVGFAFAALISLYIQAKNKYKTYYIKYVLLIPLIFILPNIKEVGYWFSYIVILFIIIDIIYNKKYQELKWCTYLLFLVLLSKYMWYYYVNSVAFYNINSFYQVPFVSLFKILSIYREKAELIKIMIKGMSAYFYSSLVMRYTYYFIIITICSLIQFHRKYLGEYLRNLFILFIGFCLYIAFRIDLYINIFSTYEAERIASCYRYFDTYIVVFSFLSVCYFQDLLSYIHLKKKMCIIYYSLAIIFSTISIKQFWYIGEHTQHLLQYLKPLTRQNKLKNFIKNKHDETLNFKDDNIDQLDCYIFNYLEAPYTKESEFKQCIQEARVFTGS